MFFCNISTTRDRCQFCRDARKVQVLRVPRPEREEDMSEKKTEDRVLDEARKQALKRAVAKHTFGKSYDVSVKSGKMVLKRKQA